MRSVGRPAERNPVLITGGAGFIGTNLADRMLRQGRPVMHLRQPRAARFRTQSALASRDARRTGAGRDRGCARNSPAARRVARSRTVFHLASQVAVTTSLDDPGEDFEVNARGTLERARDTAAPGDAPPLIFTSTNKVYGALTTSSSPRRGTATSRRAGSPRHGIAETGR